MSSSIKPVSHLKNAKVDGALLRAGSDIALGTGVTQTSKGAIIRRATLTLTNVAVAVTAALDYGSSKLADLPNGNILYLGGIANLTFVSAGIDTSNANVDVAVGTAAASNATLATTMLNLIPKIDATSGAVVKGAATSTEAAKVFATSTSSFYLNVAAATTIDGTVTVSGTIEFFYIDLGNQA